LSTVSGESQSSWKSSSWPAAKQSTVDQGDVNYCDTETVSSQRYCGRVIGALTECGCGNLLVRMAPSSRRTLYMTIYERPETGQDRWRATRAINSEQISFAWMRRAVLTTLELGASMSCSGQVQGGGGTGTRLPAIRQARGVWIVEGTVSNPH